MDAGREGDVEGIKDEEGQEDLLDQELADPPQAHDHSRDHNQDHRYDELSKQNQQHDVHIVDEGVGISYRPNILWHR